jgi:hypothetical protein
MRRRIKLITAEKLAPASPLTGEGVAATTASRSGGRPNMPCRAPLRALSIPTIKHLEAQAGDLGGRAETARKIIAALGRPVECEARLHAKASPP